MTEAGLNKQRSIALEFAGRKHQGQKRKNGEIYINHLVRVANRLVEQFKNDLKANTLDFLWTCGVLHDILEDTATTEFELQELFSQDVANVVKSVTHWQTESYLEYILRVRKHGVGILVKLADLEDNLNGLQKGTMRDKYMLAKYIINSGCSNEINIQKEFNDKTQAGSNG